MSLGEDGSLERINGKYFYYAFWAGAQRVFAHQKQLNKINVFPVPDGDTGTNLATTFQYILQRVRPEESLYSTVRSIASAALEGSRGNSGIIIAQFLHGLSEKLGHALTSDGNNLVSSLRGGLDHMVQSIQRPVEGTIITVIREWIEYLEGIRERVKDIRSLFGRSISTARQSLQSTMEMLDVLKKNRVVDAGAQGFVHFLEGLNQLVRGRNLRQLRTEGIEKIEEVNEIVSPQNLTYRYCTETLLTGENLDKEGIIAAIRGMGDSLVVAGSGTKLRIHIHTNQPADFFYSLRNEGYLRNQKVDDMERQYQVARRRKWDIALVTDSVCDLPMETLSQYQIHMVPLSLFFGKSRYLDKISITPDQFYEMLAHAKDFPTTSQPNLGDFKALYSFLCSHYQSVIAIHITKQFSGTWQNSLDAAVMVEKSTGRRISVINSKTLSGSQGLLVYRAAEAIASGASHEDIVSLLSQWIEKTFIYVSVKNFDTMVRGGRVSPMKGRIAKWLNLKPIISMDAEGRSILLDKAFSQEGNVKKISRLVRSLMKRGNIWNYTVLHGHDQDAARQYARDLEEVIGKPPAFTVDISPAVGVSAGQGALAVSLMLE